MIIRNSFVHLGFTFKFEITAITSLGSFYIFDLFHGISIEWKCLDLSILPMCVETIPTNQPFLKRTLRQKPIYNECYYVRKLQLPFTCTNQWEMFENAFESDNMKEDSKEPKTSINWVRMHIKANDWLTYKMVIDLHFNQNVLSFFLKNSNSKKRSSDYRVLIIWHAMYCKVSRMLMILQPNRIIAKR